MRRMTVELVPNPGIFDLVKDISGVWDIIDSVEILDVLKLDFEKGMKIVLAEITLRQDVPLEEVYAPGFAEVIAILRRDGLKYTAIAKTQAPPELLHLMRKFDMDLIWDVPIMKSRERIVTTVLGKEAELKRYLDLLAQFGKVKNVSFQSVSVHQKGVLGNLTRKQREVLLAAKRAGYYDYPRRVKTESLARKMGVRKSTLIEHLRRAENRLIQEVLAEY